MNTQQLLSRFLLTLSIAFSLVTVSVQSVAGDAEKGEKLVGTCAACHGTDGNSPAPAFPKIAGLGEKYLYKQLKDVQRGARVIVEMTGMLDSFNDQD